MSDIDWKIYRLFDRCASAKLPVIFCGDDPTRKWELIQILENQLRTSSDSIWGNDDGDSSDPS